MKLGINALENDMKKEKLKTIRISSELLKKSERFAEVKDKNFSEVVREALREKVGE